MKVKVKLPDGYGNFLVFETHLASAVAELLQEAKLFNEGGYGSGAKVERVEGFSIGMEFVQDGQLAPVDPKLAAALKQYEDANHARWKADGERKAAEQKLAEATAALDALKAVTVCNVLDPGEEETMREHDPEPGSPEYEAAKSEGFE